MDRTFASLGMAAVVIVGILVAKNTIVGGPLVTLNRAEPLTGAISQSLATAGTQPNIPMNGVDYVVHEAKYFNDRQWVVVNTDPVNNRTNSAYVVMRLTEGNYRSVLGPGTIFPEAALDLVPTNVAQYIKNHGLTYEPVPN